MMAGKQGGAFVTARRGFCYLAIKVGRRNFGMMRIRKYTIDADEKRHMRRLYPEIAFDWKKITQQLAEKREACRRYRSRRKSPDTARHPGAGAPLCGVSSQAPAPSTSAASRPAPQAWERCLMPFSRSTAAWRVLLLRWNPLAGGRSRAPLQRRTAATPNLDKLGRPSDREAGSLTASVRRFAARRTTRMSCGRLAPPPARQERERERGRC